MQDLWEGIVNHQTLEINPADITFETVYILTFKIICRILAVTYIT